MYPSQPYSVVGHIYAEVVEIRNLIMKTSDWGRGHILLEVGGYGLKVLRRRMLMKSRIMRTSKQAIQTQTWRVDILNLDRLTRVSEGYLTSEWRLDEI